MSDKKIGCVGHDCAECAGAMVEEWQGLTDLEIGAILDNPEIAEHCNMNHFHLLPFAFARAIEAALKEKNT